MSHAATISEKKRPITHGRLPATALGMAIIIALVIGILSSFFVMKSHLQHSVELRIQRKEALMYNSSKGIEILLQNPDMFSEQPNMVIDLFDAGEDSLLLETMNWGMFQIARSTAYKNGNTLTQIALIGEIPMASSERTGLYVTDQHRQLSICGATNIRGHCYLPKAGVKRTYIEGQQFIGTNLIQGTTHISGENLPPMNNISLRSIEDLISGTSLENDSLVAFETRTTDTITQPFSSKRLVLFSDNTIVLSQLQITGNVIIHSSANILVRQNSHLKDVILISPKIEFEKEFEGTLQAFSDEFIHLSEGTTLHFPSALGLIAPAVEQEDKPSLVLEGDSEVSGIVFATCMDPAVKSHALVTFSDSTKIMGSVYINGELNLKGSILGSVWCNKIVLRTHSSIYENQLLNVTIDPHSLSEFYSTGTLFQPTKYSIVAWL